MAGVETPGVAAGIDTLGAAADVEISEAISGMETSEFLAGIANSPYQTEVYVINTHREAHRKQVLVSYTHKNTGVWDAIPNVP